MDPEAFEALVSIVERTEAHAKQAVAELKAGKYETVTEYSNVFGDGRVQYKMDEAEMLKNEYNSIFRAFSEWLSEWEI